jgi:integrase
MMLATGKRIGETSAMVWDRVELDKGTVEITGTVIRVKVKVFGSSLDRRLRAGHRKLLLPSWAVAMLRRRRLDNEPNRWGAVFTSPTGLLRDPSSTQADLREVFDRIGYGWVTSHVFRKTARPAGQTPVTVTDDAGSVDAALMGAIHRLNHLLESHEGRQEDQHARASIRGHADQ